jgi:hypothetical protein
VDDATGFAAELTRCADRLTGTAGELSGFADIEQALGGAPPGRLGALTVALRQQWQAALIDRTAEAADAGVRLSDVAAGLRAAAAAYQDSDAAADRHHHLGGS